MGNVLGLLVLLGLTAGVVVAIGAYLRRAGRPGRLGVAAWAATMGLGVVVLVVLSQLLPPGEARVENNVENIKLRGVIMAGLAVAVGGGGLVARRWHPTVGTGVAIGALVLLGCNFLLFLADLLRGF